MKKRFRAVMALLLLGLFLGGQGVRADSRRDFLDAVRQSDLQKIQTLLKPSGLSPAERRQALNLVLNYSRPGNTLAILNVLTENGISPTGYDLYVAVTRSHSDEIIRLLLDKGAEPNGEILLAAAKNRRFSFVGEFAAMGIDVDFRYSEEKTNADGMTALMYAAGWGDLEAVKALAENGADINLRAKDGGTACSYALAQGQAAVYDYLKELGALDFEQEENAPGEGDSPASGPAAPRQGGADQGSLAQESLAQRSQAQGSLAQRSLAQGGLGELLLTGPVILNNGTFRLSGSTMEIKLAGTGGAGAVTYTDRQGTTHSGTFRTESGVLRITTQGREYSYQIVSAAAFSGGGEVWLRVGD